MAAPAGYRLTLSSDFDDPSLPGWLPFHLPQWSSREQAAARWSTGDGVLTLRIDPDQAPWCPELDGHTRVSSVQTGVRSGPVGSADGQHRFSPYAVVREEQPEQWLCTPTYGYIETRMRAVTHPTAMVALWMIGIEREPHESAELCIAEIFGKHVTHGSARIGSGLHPFDDPGIKDEFTERTHEMDTRDFHLYAADWTPDHVDFFVDDVLTSRVHQAPDYPMQLMLGLYEFSGEITEPVTVEIDHVRVYEPELGAVT
jgi:hypothetical protein